MAQARAGKIATLVIAENDLTRRLSPAAVVELLEAVPNIVIIDHTDTPPCRDATLVLPAAAFSECSGTLVSQEGRAQRFFQAVYPPPAHPGGMAMDAGPCPRAGLRERTGSGTDTGNRTDHMAGAG
nr:molybdopterin-dependent oxidoreductase [Komagataeibacter saccharivorans]